MRVVFFVRKVDTTTGKITHQRSFIRDNVKNPFAYRKILERNEAAKADKAEKVTVGFDTNKNALRKWMDENPIN